MPGKYKNLIKCKCKVCGKTFYKKKRAGTTRVIANARPGNAKTCSTGCSKINYDEGKRKWRKKKNER